MLKTSLNRREFVRAAAITTAVGVVPAISGERENKGVAWPIGCFSRPWTKWSYEAALDGIKTAGYGLTGLLGSPPDESFTSAAATPEYLSELKRRISTRGLAVNASAIWFKPEALFDDNLRDVRKQIENAARLELKFMLTFGVDRPEHYENFYRLIADAAAHAARHGIQIVIKPHGGVCAASGEILRCLEKVGHANFKVWYDAGNIVHYTGKDPLAELEPVVRHVTGFCAKQRW